MPKSRSLIITSSVTAVLVLLALVPRFAILDAKPAMHDESMFAYYAWLANQPAAPGSPPNHYVHMGILHGPVQMQGIAWFFRMFGDSLGSARAYIACWSMVMLIAGLWLAPRRWRWWFAPLWFTSPFIIYYSRYLHEEMIFNGAFLVGMAGAARGFRRNWIGTVGLLLALVAMIILVAKTGYQPSELPAQMGPIGRMYSWNNAFLSKLMALLMLAAAGVCGMLGVQRGWAAGLWAALAGVALFFPLAVKESALFVYASGFTFVLVWAAVHRLWRRPAPGLSWLPRRRELSRSGRKKTAETKPPKGALRTKKESAKDSSKAVSGRGRKYMHRSFQEVVGADAENQDMAAGDNDSKNAADPTGEAIGTGAVLNPAMRAPIFKTQLASALIWTLGLTVGMYIVFWIYGVAHQNALPTWGPRQYVHHAVLNMRASWNYWLEQHKIDRMTGPVDYYFPLLVVYELPLLLLMWAGLAWDATRRRGRAIFYLVALAIWLLIYSFYYGWMAGALAGQIGGREISKNTTGLLAEIVKFLHIDPSQGNRWSPQPQFMILGLLFTPLLAWSVLCLKQHRPLAAWFGWWAACSLFQYSTAGEKGPWLNVNIIVPLYLAIIWIWAPHLKSMPNWGRWGAAALVIGGTVISARNDFYLVGKRSADPREHIIYNHTPVDYDKVCRTMLDRWKLDEATMPLKQRRVLFAGPNPGWPGNWYFRHCTVLTDIGPLKSLDPSYDLIIGDDSAVDPALREIDLAQWSAQKLSLRSHWLVEPPDRDKLKRWWYYYWFRDIWPPPGSPPKQEPLSVEEQRKFITPWPITAIIPMRGR